MRAEEERQDAAPLEEAEVVAVRLGSRGRLVLPSGVRERLEVREGELLLLRPLPEGGYRLTSLYQELGEVRGIYRDLAPGRSLVDELIAERRREAAAESALSAPLPGKGEAG